MSTPENELGISLSGGGYRAAAFHLGTLKKLNDLGILRKASVISTISGGSITGACYCSKSGNFDSFYNDLYNGLQKKNVIRRVLLSATFLGLILFALLFLGPAIYFLFTPYAWLFPILFVIFIFLLLKYQFLIFPVSKRIEKIYDKFFYQNKKLGELPIKPILVIGSTNLQTARPFTFSRDFMQDSTYQFMTDPVRFKPAQFPISRAVMASSCVPFAFTPVSIDAEFFEDPTDAKKFHPALVDGGVYDNQGIHKVMQAGSYACPIVITSDAGAGGSGELQFRNTIALLIETVNVFMSRIKNIQMIRNVYDNASTANRQIAYFSLGWDTENCIKGFIKNLDKKQIPDSVIKAHKLKEEWIREPMRFEAEITAYLKNITGYDSIQKPDANEKKIARSVGTNLTSLTKIKVDCLIKQAKALTEIQVKLYCPSLFQHS